jgi:hypothetical protein
MRIASKPAFSEHDEFTPPAEKCSLDRSETTMTLLPKEPRTEGNLLNIFEPSKSTKYAPESITVRDMPYIVMHLHAPTSIFTPVP